MFHTPIRRLALLAPLAALLMAQPAFAHDCNSQTPQTQPMPMSQGAPPQYMPQQPQYPVQEPPLYLTLDKQEYGPNEQIRLRFKALPNFTSSAWIGMLDAAYPHGDANENDRHDLTYQYLKSRLSGELVFDAPRQPGTYDFRLNDNGREYYAVPFTVVEKSFVHTLPGVALSLDKTTYAPGETIRLRFQSAPELSGSAWVGVLDAKYPHGDANKNDQHDIAYQYLQNRMSGELTFKAPTTPGNYDFRLNDNGREFFSVPFHVKTPAPAVKKRV